ncbi:hypothetical protein MMC25_003190 [Agyrium rufum]|nr:hypothetical protein [Agyrium rufum]
MKRGTKRGSSATQRMLSERTAQLDAEYDSNGHPSIWRDVHALMQCPGPPCDLGPHCWRSPVGEKHYKLRTHHLRALIDFVEEAGEQLGLERHAPTSAPTPFPPITIINVLPSSHQPSIASFVDSLTHLEAGKTSFRSVNIPGILDAAVQLYSKWQQSNLIKEDLKTDGQIACDAALDEVLDLEQTYTDQNYKIFALKGVKRGVARRFVHDIAEWAKRRKKSHSIELQ